MAFAVGNTFVNGTLANADEVNDNFTDIENEFNDVSPTEQTLTHITPIGAIIAWAKSITNMPSLPFGWIECDGSTISDADSPINGQTIPDLNGGSNRMLRGASTSGGTTGSDTHTHSVPKDGWGSGSQAGGQIVTLGGSGDATADNTTGSGSTIPASYEVVWIMRFK